MSLINLLTIPPYCERLISGFFAEPLNLFTNVFFIVSAFSILRTLKAVNVNHRFYLQYLAFIIAGIGFGSGAFHAVPNRFTLLLDVVPIYVFIFSALIFVLKRLTDKWTIAILLTSFFASLLLVASIFVPESFLNGSVRHVITSTCIFGLFCWCYKKYGGIALRLLLILLVYGLGIAARSMDRHICSLVPAGTHFAWHTLTATTTYLLLAFLIKVDRTT